MGRLFKETSASVVEGLDSSYSGYGVNVFIGEGYNCVMYGFRGSSGWGSERRFGGRMKFCNWEAAVVVRSVVPSGVLAS